MQENTAFPCVPLGKFKRFGDFGPPYQVGQALRRLPDGDWLVEITIIQTGETTSYRLSRLDDDPEAY
jgi:hypothetical protein